MATSPETSHPAMRERAACGVEARDCPRRAVSGWTFHASSTGSSEDRSVTAIAITASIARTEKRR